MKVHLLVPVLLMTSACSLPPDVQLSSSPAPLLTSAAGCRQLESSPGLPGRPLEPTLVRLDAAAFVDGAMRMHLISAVSERGRDVSQWGMTEGGDRVALHFSNGFSGAVVRAAIHGDQLRGRGRTREDTPRWFRRGRVRGVRVPCPAEPAAG